MDLKNPYLRVFAAGCLVVVLYWILGTDRYMGAGNQLIEQAVEHGQTQTFDFFWKMLLTALAMRAGFRGGEIVPSFAIGATFGCLAGQIMGFSPSLSAAAGMTAVFCGVTNCPVTSILIAFELFGFQGVRIICWLWRSAMQCPDITGCIKTRRSCTQNIRRNM